jgi:hypothetical protein
MVRGLLNIENLDVCVALDGHCEATSPPRVKLTVREDDV